MYLNFISRLEIVRSHDNAKRKSIIEQQCTTRDEKKHGTRAQTSGAKIPLYHQKNRAMYAFKVNFQSKAKPIIYRFTFNLKIYLSRFMLVNKSINENKNHEKNV